MTATLVGGDWVQFGTVSFRASSWFLPHGESGILYSGGQQFGRGRGRLDRPSCTASRGRSWIRPCLTVAVLALTTGLSGERASAQVPATLDVGVFSALGGEPVAEADVRLEVTETGGTTDRQGRVRLTGLTPGPYRVTVSAAGFETAWAEGVAENGRTARVRVELIPTPLLLDGLEVVVGSTTLPGGGVELLTSLLPPTVQDLSGALAGLPGVTIVRSGGPGSSAGIQLRGSGVDQVLVLLDGTPLQSPLSGETDLSTVDLASLERIVVLPGARSARYGPRALGGVVLLESAAPHRSSVAGSLSTGAWGTRDAAVRSAWADGSGLSASVGGQWATGRGDFTYQAPAFRGGGTALRENAGFDSRSGQLRAALERSGLEASIRLHGSALDRGSAGTIAQPSLTGFQVHRRSGASATLDLGGERRGLSGMVSAQRQRAEYEDAAPPFGEAYDHRAHVDRRSAAVESWTGGPGLRLRAGIAVAGQDIEASSLEQDRHVSEAAVWGRAEATRSTDWGLVDARIGARVDQHDLIEDATFSPAVELGLERWGARVDLAVRRAFAPPGVSDLFFQEGVLVRANPDLRPERVRSEVSLAGRRDWSVGRGRVELRTEAYRADVSDMILWFPDFQFVWSPSNFDVRRDGVEAGATVYLPWLGRMHPVGGRVGWSRVEYDGPALSGQVAHRPRFTADVDVAVALPWAEVTARSHWMGSRRSIPGSELNRLPGYSTTDVGLSLPLTFDALRGRVDVSMQNVFDAPVALFVDYPLPGRGWSVRLRVEPPAPF